MKVKFTNKNAIHTSDGLPAWSLNALSFLGISFGIVFVVYLKLIGEIPPSYVGGILGSISIGLGAVLPQLRYPKRSLAVIVSLIVLVCWYTLLGFTLPTITKQMYISQATKVIPVYSGANLENIGFSPSKCCDTAPSVTYFFTSNSSKDYQGIRDFYNGYLIQRGWKLQSEVSPIESDVGPYVIFSKPGAVSGMVTIYGANRQSNKLEAVISF